MLNSIFKKNYSMLLPILVFLLLITPYWGIIPYLDSNIDFLQIHDFYEGGFPQLFQNWVSVHPPLKMVLFSFIFYFPQNSLLLYSIIGTTISILGLVGIYNLAKQLFEWKIAFLSTLLLATAPLYITTSLFGLTDLIVSVLILLSLLFYSKEKYFYYSLFTILLVLTKETGLILPLVILLVEILFVYIKKVKSNNINWLFFISPIILEIIWFTFLRLNSQSEWKDWIFAETASKGAIYTIINNLLTLKIFNKYALQQWQQFFILNFNWVFWIIIILGVSLYFVKNDLKSFLKNSLSINSNAKLKTILVMIFFGLIYLTAILSFQTFTIPRYALPLYPLMIILTALAITQINKTFVFMAIPLFSFMAFISFFRLFFSADPISTKLWGETIIFKNQVVYNMPSTLSGNDGITYNLQFLEISKKRSEFIMKATTHPDITAGDFWLFPDINNDKKTLNILKNQGYNFSLPSRSTN